MTSAREPQHPPHVVDVGRLPRQPLADGDGATRDIWTVSTPGLDLVWQLKLLELRGHAARLRSPAQTHQLVVGLSGPQVLAGPTDRQLPLRRDRAMLVRSPVAQFRRSRLRTVGASRVLVVSVAAEAREPRIVFDTLAGLSMLPRGTGALIVLDGRAVVDGESAPPDSAVIVDPMVGHSIEGVNARVVIVSFPGAGVRAESG